VARLIPEVCAVQRRRLIFDDASRAAPCAAADLFMRHTLLRFQYLVRAALSQCLHTALMRAVSAHRCRTSPSPASSVGQVCVRGFSNTRCRLISRQVMLQRRLWVPACHCAFLLCSSLCSAAAERVYATLHESESYWALKRRTRQRTPAPQPIVCRACRGCQFPFRLLSDNSPQTFPQRNADVMMKGMFLF